MLNLYFSSLDLDIPLPPSFAASLKRARDVADDDENTSLPDAKNRKTTSF